MAGQQSAGFDLVMEFSETPLRDVFGVFFDTSDLLCPLLDAVDTGPLSDDLRNTVQAIPSSASPGNEPPCSPRPSTTSAESGR